MLFLFTIAIICTIVFTILMLKSKKGSTKKKEMIRCIIISIVFVIGIPIISYISKPSFATITSSIHGEKANTDKNGIYTLKLSADNKRTKIKVNDNPYIMNEKNNGNKDKIIIKLPKNIENTDIDYVGSGKGMNSNNDYRTIHNNSNAYKKLKKVKEKEEDQEEDQEFKQEEIDDKKKEQDKKVKEEQYKSQYTPIENVLNNPLKATEDQRINSYLIKGKVIDMAALPTGVQYIIQDKNDNKYFTFVNKGDLRGGNRANIDDNLIIYTNGIYTHTISQNDLNNGMENSNVGEKVTNVIANRVYLKREE